VNEDTSWPTVTELVEYALAPDDPADKEFMARLRRARAANPEMGRDIFLMLIRNPLSRVREFAVTVGPEFGGAELIEVLPELLDDPAWSVQERTMQSLCATAPGLLRNHVETLRRKFTEWRGHDDDYPLVHLAWTAVELDITELAPEVRKMAQDETLPSGVRRQAEVRATYLDYGPAAILRRIEEHDHDHMLFLCRLAWMKDLEGARAAYDRCAASAPDEACQKRCRRFAERAADAEAAGEPLSARPRPA
jgi:hypothetical protein